MPVSQFFLSPSLFYPEDKNPLGKIIPGREKVSCCKMGAELTQEHYKQLVEYIRSTKKGSSGSYPDWFTANQKREPRQQAECFKEKGGVLFIALQLASESKLCRAVAS
jgi:hypothetical protein